MTFKLYEITQSIDEIANTVPEDADEQQALEKRLDDLQLAFEYKAENIAKFLRNLDAEENAVDAEVARLKTHANRVQRAKDWLRHYLQSNMTHLGIKSVKTDLFNITVSGGKSAVVVRDQSLIPKQFLRTKIVQELDKEAVLKHYKETGEIVDGCDIRETSYLRIT